MEVEQTREDGEHAEKQKKEEEEEEEATGEDESLGGNGGMMREKGTRARKVDPARMHWMLAGCSLRYDSQRANRYTFSTGRRRYRAYAGTRISPAAGTRASSPSVLVFAARKNGFPETLSRILFPDKMHLFLSHFLGRRGGASTPNTRANPSTSARRYIYIRITISACLSLPVIIGNAITAIRARAQEYLLFHHGARAQSSEYLLLILSHSPSPPPPSPRLLPERLSRMLTSARARASV